MAHFGLIGENICKSFERLNQSHIVNIELDEKCGRVQT